ncbi:cyclopropane fatty-acyl-phospholipid synthase-like methyltransferase [Paenibacillus turicensis]|uniref:Cyclopropane fatty-acyl-phospholipid synthase-like methyltransferase n=1 Tax=Paenibacillus turicensis TaxID=160487 RepID=A0ABS4FN11_9BACL|nr:cyclopropane fatty-acyl-phospholipid synthase-like methyltransferase [Paenibacillus turicensis]
MTESIYTNEDILYMLDSLLKEQTKFNWDVFYSDRAKPIPFFVSTPDENLVQYFKNSFLTPGGTVLELGCGAGRNAIYFAKQGYDVDAVDLSSEALQWGIERAKEQGLSINFIFKNIFDLDIQKTKYDVIYDSGCFHHIAPHRRIDYVNLINRGLKPGGFFGITCFAENGNLGGSDISDWEVYRQRSLRGGLGYTPEKLKMIFKNFQIVEIRRMRDFEQPSNCFGKSGLWVALFEKRVD